MGWMIIVMTRDRHVYLVDNMDKMSMKQEMKGAERREQMIPNNTMKTTRICSISAQLC